MTTDQTEATGVILAGGRARRMDHRDKGLILYRGRPMVSYAVEALSGVARQTLINANRNLDHYRQFGLPVVTDATDSFDGPLAGILAAMRQADSDVLLVVPCDSPLILPGHLRRLMAALVENRAEAAVACDGERWHPVFLALRTSLAGSLQRYLDNGQRKIGGWLEQLHTVPVDFSKTPELFVNVNTPAELTELESRAGNGHAQ
ncbi:molybdenum cofactor guanylyltransferase MobA [Methylosarcina fibrata]|uniref:molybdenum cofactor guanylyltransferase MobA n=1 Tax=Methylosarcina fibrata TaxID=105972 RepID=UPI0003761176|nr:molybdenum cofactor guanylyltransferase MobA [Methylosarcina fibrata]